MTITWKDTSSFRQGDTQRIPNTFRANVGKLRLTVHRHIHYDKNDWLLSCDAFCDCKVIGSGTAEEAKTTAEVLIKEYLMACLEEIL